MTTDLWFLVATGLIGPVMPLIYLIGRAQTPGGLPWAFGNRDLNLAVPDWTARAIRAHQNLTENIATFAILVLVAHVTGKSDSTTALGAEIFFFGRVAYAAIYTAGILYLRTIAFFVAVGGEILILVRILS